VVYGCEDEALEDAARLLEQYHRRRLPVLNRRQQLVGMVDLGDVAVQAGTQPVAATVLAQV
jgi:CBS domain-containing protein